MRRSSPACSSPAASFGVTACRSRRSSAASGAVGRGSGGRRRAPSRRACAGRRGRAASWRGARGLAQARGEHLDVVGGHALAADEPGGEAGVSRSISPAANSDRVPRAPGLEREPRRHLEPRVRGRAARAAAAPARGGGPRAAGSRSRPSRGRRRRPARARARRAARAGRATNTSGSIGPARRVGPAEAAQVGHDQPPLAGEPRDHARATRTSAAASRGRAAAARRRRPRRRACARRRASTKRCSTPSTCGKSSVMRRRASGP